MLNPPAEDAMRDGRSPIIIDNTNIQAWEMKPYVKMASGDMLEYCLIIELQSFPLVLIQFIRTDFNRLWSEATKWTSVNRTQAGNLTLMNWRSKRSYLYLHSGQNLGVCFTS